LLTVNQLVVEVPPLRSTVARTCAAPPLVRNSRAKIWVAAPFWPARIRVAVPPVVACIGPITADTARAAGLTVDVVAAEHTIDGLVAALLEVLGPAAGKKDEGCG